MSQKTKTELEILLTTYDTSKSPETAHKLVELLRSSLISTLKEKSILEADIRKLEIFLSKQ
jgi:HPt (histidine-containing phosphotransfer) domain-containing protein